MAEQPGLTRKLLDLLTSRTDRQPESPGQITNSILEFIASIRHRLETVQVPITSELKVSKPTVSPEQTQLNSFSLEIQSIVSSVPTNKPIRSITEDICLTAINYGIELDQLLDFINTGPIANILCEKLVNAFYNEPTKSNPNLSNNTDSLEGFFEALKTYSESTSRDHHLFSVIQDCFPTAIKQNQLRQFFVITAIDPETFKDPKNQQTVKKFLSSPSHTGSRRIIDYMETAMKLRLTNEVRSLINSEAFLLTQKANIAQDIISVTVSPSGKINPELFTEELKRCRQNFKNGAELLIDELTGHIVRLTLQSHGKMTTSAKREIIALYSIVYQELNGNNHTGFFTPPKIITPKYLDLKAVASDLENTLRELNITSGQEKPSQEYYNWLAHFTNQPELITHTHETQKQQIELNRDNLRKLKANLEEAITQEKSIKNDISEIENGISTQTQESNLQDLNNKAGLAKIKRLNIELAVKKADLELATSEIALEIAETKNASIRTLRLDAEFYDSFAMARSLLIETQKHVTAKENISDTAKAFLGIPEITECDSMYSLLNIWNHKEALKEKYGISDARIMMEIIRMKNLVLVARMLTKDPQIVNLENNFHALVNHFNEYLKKPEDIENNVRYVTYQVETNPKTQKPEIKNIQLQETKPDSEEQYIELHLMDLVAPQNITEAATNSPTKTRILVYSKNNILSAKDLFASFKKMVRYGLYQLGEKGYDQIRSTWAPVNNDDLETVIKQSNFLATQDGTTKIRKGSTTSSSSKEFDPTYLKGTVNAEVKGKKQHVLFENQIMTIEDLIKSQDPRFDAYHGKMKSSQMDEICSLLYPFLFHPELWNVKNPLGAYQIDFE